MRRAAAAAVLAAGLVLASASGAMADDRGNHGAIWKAGQHGALASGTEWGPMIGGMASVGGLKPFGVSEGVHDAKGQLVPGQNK